MAIDFLTMNFEINLIFLIKPLFRVTKTAQAKIWTWDPGLWDPGPGTPDFGTLDLGSGVRGPWVLGPWGL